MPLEIISVRVSIFLKPPWKNQLFGRMKKYSVILYLYYYLFSHYFAYREKRIYLFTKRIQMNKKKSHTSKFYFTMKNKMVKNDGAWPKVRLVWECVDYNENKLFYMQRETWYRFNIWFFFTHKFWHDSRPSVISSNKY